MARPTFPATLLDYNGVLVDDEAVHLAAFREALEPLGVDVGEAEYWERYIGFDDTGAFTAMLADAGRDPNGGEVARLVESKRPLYMRRAREGLKTFDGAAELVRRRSAVGPIVVVSGALRDEIVLGLETLGIIDDVAAIVSAENATRCKPDPEGYELGLRELASRIGADARRALVVEDSVAGVRAAKTARLACVAVAHSHSSEQLTAASADAVFPTIADLSEEALVELYARCHG